jgi:molecular chaperone HscB
MSSFKSVTQLPKIIASSSKIRPVAISRQFTASVSATNTRIRHSSTTSTQPTRPCPSCSTPLPIPSSPCPNCNRIIPIPSGLSHHSLLHLSIPISSTSKSEVFDIPTELSKLPAYGFDLDIKGLRGKMLRRQMELHPDKYSGNETDVRLARELSGRVNGAYEVLRDPLKRAEYLVRLSPLLLFSLVSVLNRISYRPKSSRLKKRNH